MEKDETTESEHSKIVKKVKQLAEKFKEDGGGSVAEIFATLNPFTNETEEERHERIAKIMLDKKGQRRLAGLGEKFRFFIDKKCDDMWYQGLPFYATGLIVRDLTKKRENWEVPGVEPFTTPGGKGYSVSFFTPFGDVKNQWRHQDTVRVIETDEKTYKILRTALESVKNNLPNGIDYLHKTW